MKRCLLVLLCAALAVPVAAKTRKSKPSAARPRTTNAAAQPAPVQPTQAPAATPAPTAEAGTPAPVLAAPAVTPLAEVVTAAPATAVSLAALPVGTAVRMKLETPISTRTSRPGDRFAGRVTEDVTLNGHTIIPVGAALEGRVAHVDEPRRIKGLPTIDLRPEMVTMPNGDRFVINAVVVDTSARPATSVNDEGKIKGRGHDGRDWKETGLATGAGAAVGGIFGGGHGLIIGAGVGATASVVHWLSKRRSADLPAGTEIIMELSRPMAFSTDTAGN